MLPDKTFAKASRILEICVSVNNKLWRKICFIIRISNQI